MLEFKYSYSSHREAGVMAQLRSPFIVHFYGISRNLEKSQYSIVMEFMEGGTLFELLHNGVELQWHKRYQIGILL